MVLRNKQKNKLLDKIKLRHNITKNLLMSIINYMYGKIIKKYIKDAFISKIGLKSINTHINFFNCLDFFLRIVMKSIIDSFEFINNDYTNSTLRNQFYYSKGL